MTADLERLRETHRPMLLLLPGYDRSRVNNPEICAVCGHLWPCDAIKPADRCAALEHRLDSLRQCVRAVYDSGVGAPGNAFAALVEPLWKALHADAEAASRGVGEVPPSPPVDGS